MKHYIQRYAKVVRFLTAGGCAAVVNLGVFYLTNVNGHYLRASIYAFFAAFLVSFLLQKYWTFKEHTHNLVKTQMLMYLATAGMNIIIGIMLLYVLVEYFGITNHLFAQVISQGLIAFLSYFVYKHVIFKPRSA